MGYRFDVYPSGMSLSMGQGTKAYVRKIGQPATELVNILDPTDEVEAIVSYEEQLSYHEKWIESLGD